MSESGPDYLDAPELLVSREGDFPTVRSEQVKASQAFWHTFEDRLERVEAKCDLDDREGSIESLGSFQGALAQSKTSRRLGALSQEDFDRNVYHRTLRDTWFIAPKEELEIDKMIRELRYAREDEK